MAELENVEVNEKKPRSNQKLKLLYLMKILMEETDEEHDITLVEIGEKLKAYGIEAERKSLYSDIENLRLFGIDVVGNQYDRTYHYQIVNRQFELAELKLLVDSVQSAKFITEKKSKELIQKIEGSASKYEAAKLDRQVNVAGRVKTMNERIYYSVDAIHEALSNNKQIEFQYFSWTVDKKMELRHEGKMYHVSPWAMCWDDEKYYLVGFDNEDQKIKHYRVDKMLNASVVNQKRLGRSAFAEVKMTDYANKLFGMFDGEMQKVTLRCKNALANVILDRFGMDVPIVKVDDEHFDVVVSVSVSKMFLGWIMALEGIKIISPEETVEAMKREIERLQGMYF